MSWALLALAVLIVAALEVVLRRRAGRVVTPRGHLRAGNAAFAAGDLERAAEHYREAIRLDHTIAEAHYRLAGVAWERGDPEAAVEHLRDCQRWAPDTAEVEAALGAAHQRLGDHEAAIRHYRRALELDPKHQEARWSLAALYHELGRTAEARDVCPDYRPPTAEEEVARRLWEQLRGVARRKADRWVWVGNALGRVHRFSVIGLLVWLLFLALRFGAGRLAPSAVPGLDHALVILAMAALVLMYAARLGARAMEALEGRYFRKLLLEADAPEEDVDRLLGRPDGPPMWRVELSGMHLVLWLGVPLIVVFVRRADPEPTWIGAAVAYMLFAWIFKFGFWMGLVLVERDRRPAWWRRYRWFGTLKGTLFALVAVPGIVFGFGVLLVLIGELLFR